MIQRNSTLAVLRESFVAGSDENLSPIMHHLWKMEGGAIYFCRSGWAHVTIDLKEYEIVKNTQVVLLPGSIIRINGSSSDFTASFFGFPKDMFREACLRLEPTFFRFMKERPCYVLPDKDTGAINGLKMCIRDRLESICKGIPTEKSSGNCWFSSLPRCIL